ncbi:MAG: DUF2281 domain-containing protein [Terriglobia bacterium]
MQPLTQRPRFCVRESWRTCALKQPKTLEEIVKYLAAADQDEVREFAERLLAKRRSEAHGQPKFTWAGALRDLRERYTSVQLQHQIARWRIEGE